MSSFEEPQNSIYNNHLLLIHNGGPKYPIRGEDSLLDRGVYTWILDATKPQ